MWASGLAGRGASGLPTAGDRPEGELIRWKDAPAGFEAMGDMEPSLPSMVNLHDEPR